MKKAAILAAVVAICLAGQAQAIEVDFTGYDLGALDGQAGSLSPASGGVSAATGANWEKWDWGSPNVSDSVPPGDPELTAAGSETPEGNFAEVNTPDAWVSDHARLNVEGVSDDGWWLSGLVQYDGEFATEGPGRMVWFGLQLYRGGDEIFGLGKGGSNDTYATFGDANAVSTVPVVSGETALLVANYDGDSLKMWVNPDLNSPAPAPDAEDTNPGDLSGLDYLYIRSGSGGLSDPIPPTGVLRADNIYLGNDSPFGAAAPLDGDYNDDAFVGQGDLDLVLLNWGDTGGAPEGWVNDQPAAGDLIGQGYLDKVLLNWGEGTAPTSSVPEPLTMTLLGLGGLGVLARQRRCAASPQGSVASRCWCGRAQAGPNGPAGRPKCATNS